jgi:hypothetical protein
VVDALDRERVGRRHCGLSLRTRSWSAGKNGQTVRTVSR